MRPLFKETIVINFFINILTRFFIILTFYQSRKLSTWWPWPQVLGCLRNGKPLRNRTRSGQRNSLLTVRLHSATLTDSPLNTQARRKRSEQ
jgi:hypothetical protein